MKNKLHILVIDDEPDILIVTGKELSDAGYRVSVANSGKKGISMAQSLRPDLIILDIMLLDIEGTDVAHILKIDKSTKNIPIIFLTSLQTKEGQKRRGTEVGPNTVFAKPYDLPEVLAKIKELIG